MLHPFAMLVVVPRLTMNIRINDRDCDGRRSVQGYHLLAAALFAPVLVLQPALLALALGVALLVMVAAEVVRLGRVPVLSALLAGRLYTRSLNTTKKPSAFSDPRLAVSA